MTRFKWLLLVSIGLFLAGLPLATIAAEEAAEPAATEEAAEPADAAEEGDSGLVAYWSFDEGEGETAKDSAGENDGTIYNPKWVDGKVGKALEFDGESVCVEVPDSEALDITDAITIEAWVKHRGAASFSWETILAKGDSSYRLHFDETDLSFGLGLNDGSAGWWNLASGVVPEADKWYFVVATVDSSKACIYVNGELATSTEDVPGAIMTNDIQLAIGENYESNYRYFNGVIDEVKIYNRALSAEEIAEQYKQAGGTAEEPEEESAEEPAEESAE
jgi:hypothetical protein